LSEPLRASSSKLIQSIDGCFLRLNGSELRGAEKTCAAPEHVGTHEF